MKPLKASTITADMELKEQLKKSKNKKQKKDVHGEEGTDELTKKYKKVHHMESVDEASVKDFNSTFAGSKSEFEKLKKDLAKNNMKVKIIKKYPDGQIDFFVQAKNPRFVKKIQKDIEKKYDVSLSTVPESVNESAILDTIPKMVKGKEKKIATQFNALLRKKKNPKEIAKVFKQFSSKTKDEVMKVLAHSSVQDLLQRGQVVQQLAGMFDEVEKPKSRVDARQKAFREKLRKLGYAKKEKNYRTPYDTFNVFEEIEKTKKEDAITRAKEKEDLEQKHKAEIEREKEEIKKIRQDESFDGWRVNKHLVNEKFKKRFVKNIKSIKKNARSLPLSRDYILNTDNLDKLTPMNNQMARAKLSTNYDHPKYGSGTEIETKKGAVLIKPEVAELYMKSRDRLPDPIKKNMDKMALRSPDGLFTVLQAALNDLQTGMIESLTKVIK